MGIAAIALGIERSRRRHLRPAAAGAAGARTRPGGIRALRSASSELPSSLWQFRERHVARPRRTRGHAARRAALTVPPQPAPFTVAAACDWGGRRLCGDGEILQRVLRRGSGRSGLRATVSYGPRRRSLSSRLRLSASRLDPLAARRHQPDQRLRRTIGRALSRDVRLQPGDSDQMLSPPLGLFVWTPVTLLGAIGFVLLLRGGGTHGRSLSSPAARPIRHPPLRLRPLSHPLVLPAVLDAALPRDRARRGPRRAGAPSGGDPSPSRSCRFYTASPGSAGRPGRGYPSGGASLFPRRVIEGEVTPTMPTASTTVRGWSSSCCQTLSTTADVWATPEPSPRPPRSPELTACRLPRPPP